MEFIRQQTQMKTTCTSIRCQIISRSCTNTFKFLRSHIYFVKR